MVTRSYIIGFEGNKLILTGQVHQSKLLVQINPENSNQLINVSFVLFQPGFARQKANI